MGNVQYFVDGLSVAGILIIVALGLSIIFGVMKVINMAHGEFIMIGAYTTYVVSTVAKLPFFIGMVVAFIVSSLVGLIVEKLIIKRLYGRPMETLLATFGLSIVLQQIIRLLFGTGGKSVQNPMEGILHIGSITLPHYRIFIILFAICIILATYYIIFKTNFGKQLRTVSENRDMSECLGINTSRIDAYTFSFGAGMAGIAGAVLAPLKNVSPTMGLDYLVDSFMVVVLGGVGSLSGIVAGSITIGETNQALTIFMGDTGAKIIVFLIVIIIIRYRPEGLFKMDRR
jgi:urea transport system permease protein